MEYSKKELMEIVANTRNDNPTSDSPIATCLEIIERSDYGETKARATYKLREKETTIQVIAYFEKVFNNLLTGKGVCVYRFRESEVTAIYLTKEDVKKAKHH